MLWLRKETLGEIDRMLHLQRRKLFLYSSNLFLLKEISQILQIERIKNNKSLAKVITAYQRVVKQTPTEKVPVSRYYIEEVNSLSDENENE